MNWGGFDWQSIFNGVPFIGLLVKTQHTPFSTRMMEAGIIAIATAGLSIYVTLPKVEAEVAAITKTVENNHQETKLEIEKISRQMEKIDNKIERSVDSNHTEINELKKDIWRNRNDNRQ